MALRQMAAAAKLSVLRALSNVSYGRRVACHFTTLARRFVSALVAPLPLLNPFHSRARDTELQIYGLFFLLSLSCSLSHGLAGCRPSDAIPGSCPLWHLGTAASDSRGGPMDPWRPSTRCSLAAWPGFFVNISTHLCHGYFSKP